MAAEEIIRRRHSYLGSFLGLFLSWLGLLAIAAGIALALLKLNVYHAPLKDLQYWGLVATAGTSVIYAVVMFALSWSFARFLGIQFLLAASFAIWSMIPIFNLIPLLLLMFTATRRIGAGGSDAGVAA